MLGHRYSEINLHVRLAIFLIFIVISVPCLRTRLIERTTLVSTNETDSHREDGLRKTLGLVWSEFYFANVKILTHNTVGWKERSFNRKYISGIESILIFLRQRDKFSNGSSSYLLANHREPMHEATSWNRALKETKV